MAELTMKEIIQKPLEATTCYVGGKVELKGRQVMRYTLDIPKLTIVMVADEKTVYDNHRIYFSKQELIDKICTAMSELTKENIEVLEDEKAYSDCFTNSEYECVTWSVRRG